MNLPDTVAEQAQPLLVGYNDAARMLGLSRRTVERIVLRDAIPSVTVGPRRLFRTTDLEAWVNAQFTTTATTPSSDRQP